MSLTVLLLVVTAALLHAAWNFLAKQIDTSGGGGRQLVWLYSLCTVVVFSPVALTLVGPHATWPPPLGWAAIVTSAILHYGYSLVLQKGYSVGDLSVVYPLARGTGPLLSSLGAIVLLGERPSWLAAIGIALVVLGVLITAGGERLLRRGAMHSGAGWGVLTGAFIAAYTLCDAYAIKDLRMSPLLYYYLEDTSLTLLAMPAALARRDLLGHIWRDNRRNIVLISILSPLSYFLVLYALRFAPVSHVAPAREMSMMVAALLGVRLLGEGEVRRRLFGAALIVVGVIALTLG